MEALTDTPKPIISVRNINNTLPIDDRVGQAFRVAKFMELNPKGVTIPQIQAACDPGSATKLLSVMRKEFGYVITKKLNYEICLGGTKRRERPLFVLVSRPANVQQDLFETL
jgi:hypothetical protein